MFTLVDKGYASFSFPLAFSIDTRKKIFIFKVVRCMDVYYPYIPIFFWLKALPSIWLLGKLLLLCTLAFLSLVEDEGRWVQQCLVFQEKADLTR